MKTKKIVLAVLIVAALFVAGCEFNGLTTREKARDIQNNSEQICGAPGKYPAAFDKHGGVENIMLMDGSEDDGIVTCADRTNHYFDG